MTHLEKGGASTVPMYRPSLPTRLPPHSPVPRSHITQARRRAVLDVVRTPATFQEAVTKQLTQMNLIELPGVRPKKIL